jgi:hypothetical protein
VPDDPKPKPRNIVMTEQEQALIIKEMARRLQSVLDNLPPKGSK